MSRRSTGWISKRRRQQIYKRDRHMCQWCERKLSPGALTLDHFVARKHGGNDCTQNLFVACLSCNSSRGALTVWEFAFDISEPLTGVTAARIIERIVYTLSRPLR
jgi:5-methylcytosine-specific restriction endonuclease McrA